MKIELRDGSVRLEGYVNVTNRDSRKLTDKVGQFIEQIVAGCWKRALHKNPNIPMLFNHDWSRKLGENGKNLELWEDQIGLRYALETDDEEVIRLASEGKLQGCSFAFKSLKETCKTLSDGLRHRFVHDLELFEVSILSKLPAYEGSSAEIRELEHECETREFLIDEVIGDIIEDEVEEKAGETEVVENDEVTTEESEEAQEAPEGNIKEEVVDHAMMQRLKAYIEIQKLKHS